MTSVSKPPPMVDCGARPELTGTMRPSTSSAASAPTRAASQRRVLRPRVGAAMVSIDPQLSLQIAFGHDRGLIEHRGLLDRVDEPDIFGVGPSQRCRRREGRVGAAPQNIDLEGMRDIIEPGAA